ncbi:hypothetical protein ACFFX0_11425 [Citricoccus parietis]|uniref:Uncharacterized protein n=1 Tax=Citricoccus parietis TaxID=592307 RepID=A0ABV5FZE9_9MICC
MASVLDLFEPEGDELVRGVRVQVPLDRLQDLIPVLLVYGIDPQDLLLVAAPAHHHGDPDDVRPGASQDLGQHAAHEAEDPLERVVTALFQRHRVVRGGHFLRHVYSSRRSDRHDPEHKIGQQSHDRHGCHPQGHRGTAPQRPAQPAVRGGASGQDEHQPAQQPGHHGSRQGQRAPGGRPQRLQNHGDDAGQDQGEPSGQTAAAPAGERHQPCQGRERQREADGDGERAGIEPGEGDPPGAGADHRHAGDGAGRGLQPLGAAGAPEELDHERRHHAQRHADGNGFDQ